MAETSAAERETLSFLEPPRGPDEIGRFGPYRIRRLLGVGAFGVVLEGVDAAETVVALKVLKPQLAADPTAQQRFLREARVTAAVASPHVVRIFKVDSAKGLPYLAMELLAGETLEQRLTRLDKLSVAATGRLAMELATGLAQAIAVYRKAIELEPKLTISYLNLAALQHKLGATKDAIATLHRSLATMPKVHPGAGATYMTVAFQLSKFDDLIGAVGAYQSGFELLAKEKFTATMFVFHRQWAARTAIFCAFGKELNQQPKTKEAIALLDDAHAWLAGGLPILQQELMANRPLLLATLNSWLTDPVLAVVRDEDKLAKLPAEQRQRWQQFWKEVTVLRNSK